MYCSQELDIEIGEAVSGKLVGTIIYDELTPLPPAHLASPQTGPIWARAINEKELVNPQLDTGPVLCRNQPLAHWGVVFFFKDANAVGISTIGPHF